MLGKELQCVSFGGHKNSADLALKRLEGEGYSIQRKNKATYSENNQKLRVRVRNESGKEDWGPIMEGVDCQQEEFGLIL